MTIKQQQVIIKQQQVIFSIEPNDDGTVEIGIVFEPELAGRKSVGYEEFSDSDKQLQGFAELISIKVMEALRN